ncbi:MAG: hypothetical protein JWN41_1269 [Thermoleophilia bacterium]|nr:hypothetical protein [Thermoleophilia bacterium]
MLDSQAQVYQRVIDEGQRHHASPKALLAAVEAVMVDTEGGIIDYHQPDVVGVFSQRGAWGSKADRSDVAKAAGMFFDRARSVQKHHPSKSAEELAYRVQSRPDGARVYSIAAHDAQAVIDAERAGTLTDAVSPHTSGSSKLTKATSRFQRFEREAKAAIAELGKPPVAAPKARHGHPLPR